jgi:hypothetical protein
MPVIDGVLQDGITPSQALDLGKNDVALLFLGPNDSFDAEPYPTRQATPAVSTSAFVIGRRAHGDLTPDKYLVRSESSWFTAPGGTTRHYYEGRAGIEGGDSGGPLVWDGAPRILGVASGYVPDGTNYFSRIDTLSCWIAHQVAAHGGEGKQGQARVRPTLDYYCGK